MKVFAILSTALPVFALAAPLLETERATEAVRARSVGHPEWPANNAVRPDEEPNAESENKEFVYWKKVGNHPEWPANNAV
ncbi:hypothetical protein BDV29DRAFT_181316 [Aspergillus leporis]|uniref:Uncharacterized protein n=1 Tax=Aspergillus leporis TaxID=41062 RepID=A0A5N5WQW1_9EURO|nr:hypothetical protein BDV29DRAFT_181316 [Aspergillus leporis]